MYSHLNFLKSLFFGANNKQTAPLNKLAFHLILGMILGISFFLIFWDLAEGMLNSEFALFDSFIMSSLLAKRSPITTEIMKQITAMGSFAMMRGIALIIFCFLFVINKHIWDAIMLVIALTGASTIDGILKLAFHRDRPTPLGLVQAYGYSFPSGHAMVSFAFYGMLVYLLLINFQKTKCTILLAFIILLLVLAIGISRIYLGVHYPSDVLAGFAAGGIWLTACIMGLHTVRYLKGIRIKA